MNLSENPKVTYALIKLEDLLNEQREDPHPDFTHITSHKDQVLAYYQPIFSRRHIPDLTKAEFESFLLFRNNNHWDSLHRVGKFMTEDMSLLREALSTLVDESRPVRERLNELRPECYWGAHSKVSHLGMPVLTAILHVTQPEKYGVWNNTSDAGLKTVRLWNKSWDTGLAGDRYMEMNELYLYFAERLQIDLWTLDALWWIMKKPADKLLEERFTANELIIARKTLGVQSLVQEILAARFSEPYGQDIIFDVCLEIEKNPAWFQRYGQLKDELSRDVVNNWIGKYVKEMTGLRDIREAGVAAGHIVKSYTKLG